MKTISRYIMTLALLITAVGGAWAQTQWTSGDCTVTLSNGTLTVSGNGAMADYENFTNRPWHDNRSDITSVVVESGVTTVGKVAFYGFNNLTSVTLPEGLTAIGVNAFRFCGKLTSITIPSTVTSIGADAFYSCASVTDVNLYADPANLTWNESSCDDFKQGGYTKCHVLAEHLSAYQNKFTGKVNVTFVGDLKPLPGTVTLNDTKTEASFDMPTSDVDVNYELVRDMSVQMPVTVQDAEQNSRFRVQKLGNTFVPVGMDMAQIVALFTVHDDIEEKNLTANTDFTVQLFAVDEEGQKTGEVIPFDDFTFAPGKYVAMAVAAEGSNYSGTTTQSNVFELFQGYEIKVAAGEYATFYKDEKLRVEDKDAVLYTIANVTDTEAQLSDVITVAPAETPLLVYNKSEQEKTFLLIPTTDKTPDNVTAATQFVGTLAEKEMPASSTTVDYYVCTGKAFEWVRDAGVIAANKCWLQIGEQPAAARAMTRSIVGGGNTTNMDDVRWQMEDGNYYDLQGRKVEKPTRGGIYIHNGKKVILK